MGNGDPVLDWPPGQPSTQNRKTTENKSKNRVLNLRRILLSVANFAVSLSLPRFASPRGRSPPANDQHTTGWITVQITKSEAVGLKEAVL